MNLKDVVFVPQAYPLWAVGVDTSDDVCSRRLDEPALVVSWMHYVFGEGIEALPLREGYVLYPPRDEDVASTLFFIGETPEEAMGKAEEYINRLRREKEDKR